VPSVRRGQDNVFESHSAGTGVVCTPSPNRTVSLINAERDPKRWA